MLQLETELFRVKGHRARDILNLISHAVHADVLSTHDDLLTPRRAHLERLSDHDRDVVIALIQLRSFAIQALRLPVQATVAIERTPDEPSHLGLELLI